MIVRPTAAVIYNFDDKPAIGSVRRDLRQIATPERAQANRWFFKTVPGNTARATGFLVLPCLSCERSRASIAI